MASLDELRTERLRKLSLLQEKGMEPYPSHSFTDLSLEEIMGDFDALEKSKDLVWVAGRITALRVHGGSAFADIDDGSGRVQLFFKKDTLGEDFYSLFIDGIDIGDFIEVQGQAFYTKREEPSFEVREWRLLSKSLRPLPEKWHGIQDDEERLRHRYLDLFLDPEKREVFRQKALFWDAVRRFMKGEGFLEVETPTLEVTTGGAEARPFITHHNDFDLEVYLRISIGELWQKRLMAAGFRKTFEVGRAYRNEGSSPEHLQEFTNMEFYAAYMNFDEGKELVKKLYRTVANEVCGKTNFTTRGHTFDLNDEWKELDYVSTIEDMTGINVINASVEEMGAKLQELGVLYSGDNKERLTDSLWKYCRKQISGPAFLVNHPKLVAPLSKEHPDNPALTKTFQVIIAGSEVGRAHAELNDPIEQGARFRVQQELLEAGDDEAMMPDWEYVEMLEHGMPPTFGFGFGERLFTFFVDKPIRETQLFPLIKPKL